MEMSTLSLKLLLLDGALSNLSWLQDAHCKGGFHPQKSPPTQAYPGILWQILTGWTFTGKRINLIRIDLCTRMREVGSGLSLLGGLRTGMKTICPKELRLCRAQILAQPRLSRDAAFVKTWIKLRDELWVWIIPSGLQLSAALRQK